MSNFNPNNTSGLHQMAGGSHGHVHITDNTYINNKFYYILVLDGDVTVSYRDYNPEGKFEQKTSETLEKGDFIIGDIRNVNVTAGPGRLRGYFQPGERTTDQP